MKLAHLCALLNLVIGAWLVAAQTSTCTFTTGGHTWDFSGLVKTGSETPWTVNGGPYTYLFNVCGQLTGSVCTAGSGSAYQALTGPPLSQCIMTGNAAEYMTWQLSDVGNPGAGLTLTYGKGSSCSGRDRETIIDFQCDPNAIPGVAVDAQEMLPPGCKYLIHFRTAYACLDAPPPPSKGGVSGGWVFFILYVVGFTVYCAVGIVVKVKKFGATGSDVIPNKDFWKDLPHLVRDGIKFSVQKLRGCCGQGGGTFETV